MPERRGIPAFCAGTSGACASAPAQGLGRRGWGEGWTRAVGWGRGGPARRGEGGAAGPRRLGADRKE